MAAVSELSVLLVSLISSIHAGEHLFIREGGSSYTFKPPKTTTSCLISRSVGGENLVLWNTSDLWSDQSSVPGPLKQRLLSDVKTSSYSILNLTWSDSGSYREECWTQGKVTHDNNIIIRVCPIMHKIVIGARPGETVDLPCEGAAGNQDVQWLKQDSSYETWSRVFGDSSTSVMDNVRGKYQVTNTSALRVSNVTKTDFTDYRCVVMDREQCLHDYRETVQLGPPSETVYRSVGETTALPCTVTDSTDEQPPRWMKYNPETFSYNDLELQNQTDPSVDQNYSLVFSSVMLNHSGVYACEL
ncbi:junctional adhesion molecule C [Etheostoma spectabile]|uniref:junctional adhesion molecule C n=1 Tax=Etheostoma spectabile TaxID=54343 RepID=UPI0013AF5453|nr:junctional adhesion molecule C-like [Etheostoma spectabile]